jgi:uncharacterized short protein YbdD (DUF466 family)
MSDRGSQQLSAAREAQFLALLRAGQAPPASTGLFEPRQPDAPATLRAVTACAARGTDPRTHLGWLLPNALWRVLWRAWQFARQLSGDDAYERYLEHARRMHPEQVPMTRAEHYAFMQDQKWSRLSRCC